MCTLIGKKDVAVGLRRFVRCLSKHLLLKQGPNTLHAGAHSQRRGIVEPGILSHMLTLLCHSTAISYDRPLLLLVLTNCIDIHSGAT